MGIRMIRFFLWLLVIALPMTSVAQEQDDFAQVAEKMAPDISKKAVAKMNDQHFRLAVFPFGDSDGKVTISMNEPNTILQEELISNLMEEAQEKYSVLDKADLKKEFKAVGIDASDVALNDPENIADILKEIGVDVAVVGSIDANAKNATQVKKDELTKINVSVTIIYQDGAAEQITDPAETAETNSATAEKTKEQYIDNYDGTITDTKTGLMWKRCAEGLSGENCEKGEAKEYDWNDEVQRFKNVSYANYSDWRMPTIDELKTLVYCSKGVKDKDTGECNKESETPTINQQAFPNTKYSRFSDYWSGSPLADPSGYAWYVNFTGGYSGVSISDYKYAVRLVRSEQ
ncbi:MAG: DUF1566 domain-containing protein [Candidatus Electrothrix sp. AW3_4]|nr:DUF1566 domain-containing protein [Candidatus Electrothrix gigas]